MWDDLPKDILAELTDEKYRSRKHYSRATYAIGCHGPLCQKAERDRGRKRNEQRGGDSYEPALKIRVPDPKNIEDIIEWHTKELTERRAAKSA